jgi:GNAT superfamily N-acetyltransferase
MALKEEAGWNQTEQDWLALFEAAPAGCFGIDIDGELAGTTTVVCYGTELAWIGMVLTGARFRGCGIASALQEHALGYAAAQQVDWVKLDATEAGRPLYRRYGFEGECTIERWMRPGGPAQWFEPQCRSDGGNYARGRPGAKAAYFGPCYAKSRQAARELLEWFLALHPGEAVYWDLFPDNPGAVELAVHHDFAPARKLLRMARRIRPGALPRPTDISQTYAIRGFEWG